MGLARIRIWIKGRDMQLQIWMELLGERAEP
jgi:hypothetical protein